MQLYLAHLDFVQNVSKTVWGCKARSRNEVAYILGNMAIGEIQLEIYKFQEGGPNRLQLFVFNRIVKDDNEPLRSKSYVP